MATTKQYTSKEDIKEVLTSLLESINNMKDSDTWKSVNVSLNKDKDFSKVNTFIDTAFNDTLKELRDVFNAVKQEAEKKKNAEDNAADTKDTKGVKICAMCTKDSCDDCTCKDDCFVCNNRKNNNDEKVATTVSIKPNQSKDVKVKKAKIVNIPSPAELLRAEYNEEVKRQEEQKQEQLKKHIPEEYKLAVFNILADKESHKYRFIKGDGNIQPAVEVKIEDTYNMGDDFAVMSTTCELIKNDGDFALVTASKDKNTPNENYITFYLVLY